MGRLLVMYYNQALMEVTMIIFKNMLITVLTPLLTVLLPDLVKSG